MGIDEKNYSPLCTGSGWVSAVIKWFVSNFIYFVAVALIILLGLSYSLYQS